MGLDERALGSTAATIAYGLTGVLSLIPAIQEISLDRKLNEDKTKLEKNAFHPDLVARHIQNNGAVFIGCGQEALEPVRQELTQGGVPFITVASSMIGDEAKRPPYFYTVVIRDIDGQRAAELLKDLLKDLNREGTGREDPQELEGDLEREIGEKDPEGDGDKPEEDDGQEEWETAEKGLDDAQEEDQEEDGGEDQEKEKKKAAAKRKAEKREERRRQDEERKRQEDKRRDDSAKQDATAAERRTKEERREAEHAGSGHGQGQERREDSPGERAGAAYAQPSIDYREAYAIRASEIEEQCERYAKAELMRRELERMKLSGEDTSDAYSLLRDQYRSANDDIRAHHDHFRTEENCLDKGTSSYHRSFRAAPNCFQVPAVYLSPYIYGYYAKPSGNDQSGHTRVPVHMLGLVIASAQLRVPEHFLDGVPVVVAVDDIDSDVPP